ncbi:HNH endonuclease [Aeromonas hydrophila]|uniref:HNH endonuclease n=1 Tax=Aeromonas hydrophila TaxID=644 RepID=UPI001C754876|nr:HNH endonuclease [Aeromonas hydrophila]QWL72376.1 HNH endonuclease [Aeromonas hydrophila]
MFNVIRPVNGPSCLLSGSVYNQSEVVSALKAMFHGKCYLCERNEIQDVEIEHFTPQGGGGGRMKWNNLFYSCSRCNSIKGHVHLNLLDCTDPHINVSREIRLKIFPTPASDVLVEPTSRSPSIEVNNTVILLELCFNSCNTALRGVSREALVEQIFEHMCTFINARRLLKNPSTGKSIRQDALETIEAMLDVRHPFSAFWRWQYLDDSFLTTNYPELGHLF